MDLYNQLGILTWMLLACGSGAAVWAMAAARRRRLLLTAAAALIAAAAFSAYRMSVASYAIRSDVYFLSLVLRTVALMLCVPGAAVMPADSHDGRKMTLALIFFTAAQALVAASVLVMDLLGGWVATLIIFAAALTAAFVLARVQRWQPGRGRVLLISCAVLQALVVGRTLAALFGFPDVSALLMFLGCGLFSAGSLLWGVRTYHGGGRSLLNGCLAAYVGATILIALSISPVMDVPLA